MNLTETLTTATPHTDREDLMRHLDAQTDTAYGLMEVAAIQAVRLLPDPPAYQAGILGARRQAADVAVLIEAMSTAATANGQIELAQRLGTAAEDAHDLLILLAHAAHGTIPADPDDEDPQDGEKDQAAEHVAA
ncbi:hypothetical protein AB0903_28180 [Streptomyces sp. NPDC048389]|uniref:hypothetical protein n=1 Tax=Streptomyces sp. NPDC048389 TaxID=3154622 RepID=UPI00345359A9